MFRKKTPTRGQAFIEFAVVVFFVVISALVVLAVADSVFRRVGAGEFRFSALTVSVPEDACVKDGVPKIIDTDFSDGHLSVTYVDKIGNIVVDRINDNGQVFQRFVVLGGAHCDQ